MLCMKSEWLRLKLCANTSHGIYSFHGCQQFDHFDIWLTDNLDTTQDDHDFFI